MMNDETKNALSEVRAVLQKHPVLFAGTMGLDKKPQVRAAQFCYEEDGSFYFAAAKSERFYAELSLQPIASFGVFDEENGRVMLLRGEAVFTEDAEIISRCLKSCPFLKEKWGSQPEMLIAWFLKKASVEFTSPAGGEPVKYELGTPEGALTGIEMKKDKEIRDRLITIMARREAESSPQETAAEGASAGQNTDIDTEQLSEEALFLQKLYDGAVLYFAETAKTLWPRMDISPIERSLLYETYDEREKFTGLARKLIGNAVIDKPEDLTYWLNKETLSQAQAE
ncbi:MAG: pyridoxamine 5'-phosphate oxidase family protein [Lachnospiraceae bacterium]|nr:pyridoxamine 5'-phosphate oxidase family protein [Lachnospiraceae bacterium]